MNVLLVGNAGYFTEEAIHRAFPGDTVVVCSSAHKTEKKGRIRWFDIAIMSEEFRRLFVTYGFERVVFVSRFVTKDSKGVGEIEELRNVFSMTQKSHINQFVYITSDEALLDVENSASIIFDSAKELCEYYARSYDIRVKVIYSPHLISSANKEDYWCDVLSRIDRGEKVEVKALTDEVAAYLSMNDLSIFLQRLFENWDDNERSDEKEIVEEIYLKCEAKSTYQNVYDSILKYFPKAAISFIKSGIKGRITYGENKARNELGWFAMEDVCEDFDKFIEEYIANFAERPTLRERISRKLKMNSRLIMIIELIGGAVLVELYTHISRGSVQFRMIDVRLLFVVLMASVYGTNVGALTAMIEMVSLAYAYMRQGTDPILLFYDPGNWIPFILLMVVAAICGYSKQKKDEEINFIQDENRVIRDENAFISDLYQEAMEFKNQYKQDLIGSRDGFARIFDVVKKLSTTIPEEIFAESIPVMEDVLGNKSIAIYTINEKNARFARLNVASEQISATLQKSINLEDYSQVLDTIMEKDIWFNSDIREGFPTYVSGIKSNGMLTVLIMIYQVDYIQIGTYYTNLIRILTGLIENFILKAWEYQKAVSESTYVGDTAITNTEYFVRQYEIQKEMAQNKLTSFRLFKILIENRSLEEIDEMLQTKIRSNDIIGLGRDGNVYLLASQVDESSEGIVLRRFRDMGLACDIVESVS